MRWEATPASAKIPRTYHPAPITIYQCAPHKPNPGDPQNVKPFITDLRYPPPQVWTHMVLTQEIPRVCLQPTTHKLLLQRRPLVSTQETLWPGPSDCLTVLGVLAPEHTHLMLTHPPVSQLKTTCHEVCPDLLLQGQSFKTGLGTCHEVFPDLLLQGQSFKTGLGNPFD